MEVQNSLNREKSLYIILSLFLLLNILLAITLSHQAMVWAGSLLLATAFLLFLLRPLFGFAIIVAEILGLGFYYTTIAFVDQWDKQLQIETIVRILLFMVTLGITWLAILQIKNTAIEMGQMAASLARLRKYDEEAKVLTLHEFLYQAETVLIAMNRRNEKGFLIKIIIKPGVKVFALKTLYEHFSQVALRSTRDKYDLVGKVSENELVILLQNTFQEGSTIVLERFKKNLRQTVNVPEGMYDIQIQLFPDNWPDAQQAITVTFPIPKKQGLGG